MTGINHYSSRIALCVMFKKCKHNYLVGRQEDHSYIRGGPNLITFFLVEEGIEDPKKCYK